MLGWEEVVVVRVEGPFTLLSPREMDGLRALGVDLDHFDDWVVGDGGEALLAHAVPIAQESYEKVLKVITEK